MVPRESAPSAAATLLVVTVAALAPVMASVRLSVTAVVAEVLPLAALPDLALVGLSQPGLRLALAPIDGSSSLRLTVAAFFVASCRSLSFS